jgi:dipeptidyl aminopeptidase/acylaminoacyl peptidase
VRDPVVAPYGSWRSPITADVIVAGVLHLGQAALDGDDVYWTEGRPTEGGRCVIVRRGPDGSTSDVTPAPFNVRTRVHEYGGGAFAVSDGTVYFSNYDDGRLYRQREGGAPEPITPEGALRYADIVVDRRRARLICVREDHTDVGRQAVNTLVAVPLDGSRAPEVLVGGHDFYSSPRPSPDGARLAWLGWNHPNMPWDGCELWVADVTAGGSVERRELVAGSTEESIFQPEWSPDGILHLVSERTGWWNLYRWRDGRVEPLCPMSAEFGKPQWVFGTSTYGFAAPDRIVCVVIEQGVERLASLDTATGRLSPIETPYSAIDDPRVSAGAVVIQAASPTEAWAFVRIELEGGRREILRRGSTVAVDGRYLSVPRRIEFPTEAGHTAHALFYPPRNDDHRAPAGERPPLLVLSHGGPTGATASNLNPGVQYWTSRGIAVLDVDYGGSTGYGRAYRRRLEGQWGVVDVDDCVNGARWLVERGEVDGARLAIRGGSAGGYTTLCALTFRDVFRAGASYFGIADLEALARDTHKFESRYLDRLIAPYPAGQDVYRARSPIHFTERLSCPVILFQGLDDKVVLPNQSEMMAAALRAKKIPVAHVTFEGEGHGFRRSENIKRCLEGELYFYSRVFGFPLVDPVDPVPIEGL